MVPLYTADQLVHRAGMRSRRAEALTNETDKFTWAGAAQDTMLGVVSKAEYERLTVAGAVNHCRGEQLGHGKGLTVVAFQNENTVPGALDRTTIELLVTNRMV